MAKQIREILATTAKGPRGTKVKVLERPGPLLMSDLSRNNPFPRQSCNRAHCPLVRNGNDCLEKCSKESVLYKAVCVRCNQAQNDVDPGKVVDMTYIGETSRTLLVRSNQHLRDYHKALRQGETAMSNDQVTSWMFQHSILEHGGPQDPKRDYKFDLIRTQRDPLSRQIEEAIRINEAIDRKTLTDLNNKKQLVASLNSKGEAFCPLERWNKEQ